MPELIVGVAVLICFFMTCIAFFGRHDSCIPCGFLLLIVTGLLAGWVVGANLDKEIEFSKTYNVRTIGNTLEDRRQVAVIDKGVIDVTKVVGKVVDEERCRLGVTKWKSFSWGMLLMFNNIRDYDIVCQE